MAMQARWKKFGVAGGTKERDDKGLTYAEISPSNELGYLPSTKASSFSDETPLNPRAESFSKPGASNHALEPWYIIIWHDWWRESLTSLLVISMFA